MMLIIDHLMNSCVHCLSCLAVCGSIYTSESRLWKIDEIFEEVDKTQDNCECISISSFSISIMYKFCS